MNADIVVKIGLYLNFYSIIEIKTYNAHYLCLSAVKNKIEIIPACFLSAHALNMGWSSVCGRQPRVLLGAAGGGHGC